MAKKKRRRRRRSVDPQKLERRRHKTKIRSLFARLGFEQVRADGVEFTFDERTGELDDIFRWQNVLVLCEYTTGRATTEHLSKKSILYNKIMANPAAWVETYSSTNTDFAEAITASEFRAREQRVRIVYASTEGVSEEIEKAFANVCFLDGTRLRYFDALSRTIHRSARHEFLTYLDLEYSEVGEQVHTSGSSSRSFPGHLLPETHSGYPGGFKVVSFYADPESLLALSYVLRQDSWRDSEGLYQRILIKSKIARMRRYLIEERRVFVNNIIVTLPENTTLNDPKITGKNIDPKELERTAPVSINVPYSANMIGLVDGQHRVFCYYEGRDALESKIAGLRKRQNLLVTGLVFPTGWSSNRRSEFQARLFLEINDNQARAKSALKQSIELILNPFSTVAIAKEITNRLSLRGPLEDMLQVSFFDPPEKIKTTSIVSYGLRPLVKLDGADSLFTRWSNPAKKTLSDPSRPLAERKEILDLYVSYCVDCINAFLIGAKLAIGPEKWTLAKKRKQQLLTPTLINGFFVCIRRLVASSKIAGREQYEHALQGLNNFPFSRYRSSGWKALGDEIFDQFFAD